MSDGNQTTDPTQDPAQTDPPQGDPAPQQPTLEELIKERDDLKADRDKWKGLSRKNEDELRTLQKAGQTPPKQDPEPGKTPNVSDEIAAFKSEMLKEKAMDKLETAAEKAGVKLEGHLRFVSVDQFISDGSVDVEAIGEFVALLPKEKPHYQQNLGNGPQGGSAQTIDQQIADAEKAGNHRLAISLKRQKAAEMRAK